MKDLKLPGGDLLCRDDRAIVIKLAGKRKILSTSCLNGGYREDLRCLFNFCEVYGSENERCEMRASTNEGHLRLVAGELGLPAEGASGLSTAAKMKYAAIRSEYYEDFSVTALVTAGIDGNGSRAGDPALWHEKEGIPVLEKPGTINIFLFIDAHLSAGALSRALVTCTEAKTAALQEVLAPSCYSSGLATGSGTDGTIIVSNAEAKTRLTNAGQHSKLGEYIGRVVKMAVKEALVAESGFRDYARGSVLKRMKRFGLDEARLLDAYRSEGLPDQIGPAAFRERLKKLDGNDSLVARASVYAHVLDLLQWELIDPGDAVEIAKRLLADIAEILEVKPPRFALKAGENGLVSEELINCLARLMAAGMSQYPFRLSS